MKRLLLGSIAVIGKAVLGVLALSAAAVAAPTGKGDFNHLTTGFPLSGGHAVAVCESCHAGGVFKGTPKHCDGCHALGKRVVATPKSNSHIVTDAPCESCHFNTATFLGARFNHATAQPEQCRICHNGRIELGKPASHGSGKKATDSCDHCHRTYAWIPASWNHIGVGPGQCGIQCHISSPDVSPENRRPTGHGTPKIYTIPSKNNYECDSCHSFIGWSPAAFKHIGAVACDSCHTKKTGHIAIAGSATCDTCHRTRSNGWLPASNHSGNEAGICRTCHTLTPPQPSSHTAEYTSLSCDVCHKSQTTWAGASGHIDLVPPHVPTCRSCHNGRNHDGSHNANSSMDCSRSGCHRPGGSEGRQFSSW